ncbi:hypothetical protein NMD1_01963 [Novosphingobium sp. MD-1]|nr:hypothetical protein NMD1_01963 [Novosphingobium sp. MD-1]
MLITRIVQALNRRKSHIEGRPYIQNWKYRTNRAAPLGDESCANIPHDCRKVILQPRASFPAPIRAGNTVAPFKTGRIPSKMATFRTDCGRG